VRRTPDGEVHPTPGAFQRRLTSENRTPDGLFLIEIILVLVAAEV
jgi:hypothetical protein